MAEEGFITLQRQRPSSFLKTLVEIAPPSSGEFGTEYRKFPYPTRSP